MTTKIIVLAAGKGTRMKSAKPKVLHHLAGKSMLAHVLDGVGTLNPANITVVIGHGSEQVREEITHSVEWAMQTEQLGTGHAVQQGLTSISDDDRVVIAYGDVPLTRPETFSLLHDVCDANTIGLLSVFMEDATGYGRIVRDANDKVTGIVEQKDATPEQLEIRESNSGMLSIQGGHLKDFLSRIDNNNAQEEYYLTDIFALAVADGLTIKTVQPADEWEVAGVNSRLQLAELERIHQFNQASLLMENGVTLRDPARVDVRGTLSTGSDSEIDVNVVFTGDCTLGSNVRIGANCVIHNSTIGDGTVIEPNTVLEDVVIGEQCSIGPFARLRPEAVLADKARVGNFVEIKKANIGAGSKVNHLSYVGDAEVGANVNVGAGTITCNYDGANKHKTIMEDDVFIGSNSALVAPVTVGKGSTVGAGSTISKDVAPGQLAITRARQSEIDGWQRPQKKKVPDIENAAQTTDLEQQKIRKAG